MLSRKGERSLIVVLKLQIQIQLPINLNSLQSNGIIFWNKLFWSKQFKGTINLVYLNHSETDIGC